MTVAAFLGDSITVGVEGAPFGAALCARLGWTQVNLGVGGSGYFAAPKFIDRIDDVIAASPDIVFVQGGANDSPVAASDPALYASVVADFFAALVAAVPTATLYVLSPWPCKGYYPVADINDASDIIEAACPPGARFIDWRTWAAGTGYTGHPTGDGNADVYYYSDNIHPNAVGSAYLGTRLAFAIRPPATGLVGW